MGFVALNPSYGSVQVMNDMHKRIPLFRKAVDENNIGAVEALMAGGCMPLDTENGENSALIMACDNGAIEMVRLLLAHGADVNYESDTGETALSTACFEGTMDVVKLLVSTGADINHVDKFGVSDFDNAAQWPEIQTFLRSRLAFKKR